MNPPLLPHAVVESDGSGELESLDDRLLTDIGLERYGPVITATVDSRLRKLERCSASRRIAAFVGTIIAKGGFRSA